MTRLDFIHAKISQGEVDALRERIAELEAQLPTPSPPDAPASDTRGLAIADALAKCDWSDVSIGNKAIISAAIEALRKGPSVKLLVEALEPFAQISDKIHSGYDDGIAAGDMPFWSVPVSSIRKASVAFQAAAPLILRKALPPAPDPDRKLARAVEALRDLLALPVAVKELGFLDKGIGTATYHAAWLRARAFVADLITEADRDTAPDIKPIVEALEEARDIQRANYGNATALHLAMTGFSERAGAALDAYRKSTTGDADANRN